MRDSAERQDRFAVRLSKVEVEMLAKLADGDGVSRSDAIRMCIRVVYAERTQPLFIKRHPWRSPL
jgi:hypothetical protein